MKTNNQAVRNTVKNFFRIWGKAAQEEIASAIETDSVAMLRDVRIRLGWYSGGADIDITHGAAYGWEGESLARLVRSMLREIRDYPESELEICSTITRDFERITKALQSREKCLLKKSRCSENHP